MKIRLDSIGLEAEIPDAAAPLVEKELSAKAEALKAARTEADRQTARADALASENVKLKSDVAAAPEKAKAEIKARFELEETAKAILGDVKLDGLGEDEIKRKVIGEVMPDVMTEGKSAEYVAALFDASIVRAAEQSEPFKTVHGDSAEQFGAAETKYRELAANRYKVKA